MPKGGRLSVHARPTAGTVTVSIADTGIGIAAGDLSRILEPLYSTKARGLGLGLAIVRAMLEKCGGSLRIESEEGRGSTFTVSLAAAPQE
jgi:two-component system sensor kinase FixL